MKPHCAFCCQHKGWIIYGWEHTGHTRHVPGQPADCPGCYEVMAPCPFCDEGRAVELSAYGERGYWHGDTPTPAQVDETCRCHERPLKGIAARQRLDEITLMLKEHMGDPQQNRRQQIAQQTRQPMTELLTDPTPASRNGAVEDDEIGTL